MRKMRKRFRISKFKKRRYTSPTNFKRKKYYKKTKKLVKGILYSQVESKHYIHRGLVSSNTASSTGDWKIDEVAFTNISQGTNANSRIGDEIYLKGMSFRTIGTMFYTGLAADSNRTVNVRVIMFQMRNYSNQVIVPTPSDIFLPNSALDLYNRALDYRKVRVIYDKTRFMQASANTLGSTYGDSWQIKKYIPIKRKVEMLGETDAFREQFKSKLYFAQFVENPLVTGTNLWRMDFGYTLVVTYKDA